MILFAYWDVIKTEGCAYESKLKVVLVVNPSALQDDLRTIQYLALSYRFALVLDIKSSGKAAITMLRKIGRMTKGDVS